MAERRDYYEVLGLDRSASADDIKGAYRKAALKWHPDRWVSGTDAEKKTAEEKFKEASEAYSVLSDPDKKARYDRFGHAGMGGNQGFSGMDDIFSHFSDIFEDLGIGGFNFGGRGGFGFGGGGFGGGGAKQRVHRGGNLRINVKMTLQDISEGVKKKVKVNKYVRCNHCGGSGALNSSFETCPTCKGRGQTVRVVNGIFGQMQQISDCPTCGGEGRIIKNKCPDCQGNGVVKGEEIIDLEIPAGVSDGMQLALRGKGNAGARNGVPGDLIVQIIEEKSNDFIRDEENIIYNLFISISQAVLGDNVEIPLINGTKTTVKIPAGIQSGDTIRLKGKGLPIYGRYGRGDMIVNVNVWIPKKINSEEEKIFKAIADNENIKPKVTEKEKSTFRKIFGL